MSTKAFIVSAAQQPTVLEAALAYANLGMSVIPLNGKRATVDWTPHQTKRASYGLIHGWDMRGYLRNVGIVTGRVSGNLVVIDLDGDEALKAFAAQFPDLTDTYTVLSGSGHGLHVYFYVTMMPDTTRATGTKIGNVELRADGCYVAAPPSIHPDTGAPYSVAVNRGIKRINNLDKVVAWIKDLIREKHGGQLPRISAQQPRKSISAWAAAALKAECANVRLALPGSRNDTLNRAAFKMGQLVGEGYLTQDMVYTALKEAAGALADHDGEQTVIRTISSGLNAGVNHPRQERSS